jgi:AraC family transcriptional regulator
LTTAAHEAGFADSAHLSRTFRDTFGLAPSRIFKRSQFIQVFFCFE